MEMPDQVVWALDQIERIILDNNGRKSRRTIIRENKHLFDIVDDYDKVEEQEYRRSHPNL